LARLPVNLVFREVWTCVTRYFSERAAILLESGVEFSRRSLLKSAGYASIGAFLPKLPTDGPLILGEGKYRYECIHDWLTPPSGLLFGDTHGVAQDSKGRIYVAHTVHANSTSKDAVCVYDSRGKYLRSWGSEFAGGAHGLDLRKEGNREFLYHCDINRCLVVKTDLEGKVIWSFGTPMESDKYKNGARFVPTNVAFSPDGGFYVGYGYGSNWIPRYDAKAT